MADMRNLIKEIAAESAQLCQTQFVAPSVRGGQGENSCGEDDLYFYPGTENV